MRYGSAGRLGLDDTDDDTAASSTAAGDDVIASGSDGGCCCSAGCGGLMRLSVAFFGLLASHITKNTNVTTTNDTITVRVGVRGCVKGYESNVVVGEKIAYLK